MDDSAQVWYDPLGYRGAKDCIRRRWYSASNIKEVFKDPDYNQSVVNKFLRKQKEQDGEVQGEHMNREQQTSIPEVDSLDANADGLILVWEYWSKDELIIEFDDLQGEPVYKGENPYDMLPFVPYYIYDTGDSMYPPSVNEVLAPMIDRKAIMMNMVYRGALLKQMPLIYAHQKAGIIPGQEIVPGVQVAELDDGDNINNFIQQIQLGGVSQDAQFWLANNEDEIIAASKMDVKAIRNQPEVTATQTKRKIETELKNIRNIVGTQMKGAETYRAILRANNIMKFVMADTQDVLINDHVQDEEGNLRSAEGSNSLVEINPEDWQDFEFQVTVKSKNESDIEKSEKVAQSERLLNTLQAFLAIPPDIMSSESKEGVKQAFDGLFEEIIKNISILDESKILKTGQGSMKIKEDIEEMKLGGDPMPEWKDEKQRQAMIATMGKALQKEMKGNKDPKVINAFTRYLLKLNEKTTQPTKETPAEAIAAPIQAPPAAPPALLPGQGVEGVPQAA